MHDLLKGISARFVGVELYFSNLQQARTFYSGALGLAVAEEDSQRYVKFHADAGFICLERKGSESYPSQDKAVLFFEVPDLDTAIRHIGDGLFVHRESKWAVLHDPEGHNIILLEK